MDRLNPPNTPRCATANASPMSVPSPRSAPSATPYDNALAETAVGLYKTECVRIHGPFRTVDELELATLSWVRWFNDNRLHSAIGYRNPVEMENEYYRENNSHREQGWDNPPSTKPGAIQPLRCEARNRILPV